MDRRFGAACRYRDQESSLICLFLRSSASLDRRSNYVCLRACMCESVPKIYFMLSRVFLDNQTTFRVREHAVNLLPSVQPSVRLVNLRQIISSGRCKQQNRAVRFLSARRLPVKFRFIQKRGFSLLSRFFCTVVASLIVVSTPFV